MFISNIRRISRYFQKYLCRRIGAWYCQTTEINVNSKMYQHISEMSWNTNINVCCYCCSCGWRWDGEALHAVLMYCPSGTRIISKYVDRIMIAVVSIAATHRANDIQVEALVLQSAYLLVIQCKYTRKGKTHFMLHKYIFILFLVCFKIILSQNIDAS